MFVGVSCAPSHVGNRIKSNTSTHAFMGSCRMLLLAGLLFCNVSTDVASSPLRDAHRTSRRLLAAEDSTRDTTTTAYKVLPFYMPPDPSRTQA